MIWRKLKMRKTIEEFLTTVASFSEQNANPIIKKEIGIVRFNMNEFGAMFLSLFGDYSDEKGKDYIIFYHKTYKELFEKYTFLENLFTYIPPKYHRVILDHFVSWKESIQTMTKILKNDWTLDELEEYFKKNKKQINGRKNN